jgi:methylthioribose-1-phosphate isomerase
MDERNTTPDTTNVLDIDTVALDDEDGSLVIIDQTKLPGSIELEHLHTREEAWRAIKRLEVRGAPAIGVAAAIATYLDARASFDAGARDWDQLLARVDETCDYLDSSRPTAVNLSWATARMARVAKEARDEGLSCEQGVRHLHDEAVAIRDEDVRTCRAIGENGLALVSDGDGILTHCNAGQLATVRYGTATAPIYLGHERGYNFYVYCDETRPLLQGARLTAFELMSAGIQTTLQCDNMSASLMRTGAIQAVFVGCDRVAANGDVANKIGTSMVALAARRYGVPFYVCSPTSTIDPGCTSGEQIEIEQRASDEVTDLWYAERMAPTGVDVYNPAFDVTDADLISGIVTEFGVARAPYADSIARILAQRDGGAPAGR